MIHSSSGFTNQLKTFALLAALGGLMVAVGGILGGSSGMVFALVLAVVMNGGVYWFSDRLALRANGARPLKPGEAPHYEAIVRDLSNRAGIPVPALYLIERPEPNAFATGRNPQHSAVAVTTGILELMDDRRLRGVLAHEISHITNRDVLVGTIAATIGGAISFLGNMALWSSMFGGGNDEDVPAPVMLAAAILAPIAATIIQLAVSRSREYGADRSGAALTQDPEGLASALETLDGVNAQLRQQAGGRFGRTRGRQQAPQPVPAATAHLYTVSPLAGGAGTLFSTHPPIADRVRRLRSMRAQPGAI
ncbi:MAG: M48 family metalloprotease [Chloroflexota bacterium]